MLHGNFRKFKPGLTELFKTAAEAFSSSFSSFMFPFFTPPVPFLTSKPSSLSPRFDVVDDHRISISVNVFRFDVIGAEDSRTNKLC